MVVVVVVVVVLPSGADGNSWTIEGLYCPGGSSGIVVVVVVSEPGRRRGSFEVLLSSVGVLWMALHDCYRMIS